MKSRLLLLISFFISFCVFAQKEQNRVNTFLQKGKYDEAQNYIDSLLSIKKYKKDAYYSYLSAKVYRTLFETRESLKDKESVFFLKKTFSFSIDAYELSKKGNSGNKIYQNEAKQTLRTVLLFTEILSEDRSDEALKLIQYIYDKSFKSSALSNIEIASVGLRYALLLEIEQTNEDAIEMYNTLLSKKYFIPELFLNLSYLYQNENDYENAIEVLLAGRNLFPKNNLINIELVNYAPQSEKSIEIIESLEKSFAIDTANFQLASSIATLYDKLGKYEKSKLYYEKAINLNPESLAMQFNLAVLLYNQFIDLNQFLNTGDSDLAFKDINAQRNFLIKQCKSHFENLRKKGFRTEEITEILLRLEKF